MPQAYSTTSMPRMTSPLASSSDLAVLGGDDPGQLVRVALDELAELEHHPRAARERHVAPGLERRLGGLHRGVDVLASASTTSACCSPVAGS